MLSTLNERGYSVEWMVVDASEYGFPQKEREFSFYVIEMDENTTKIQIY